jgi:hypothetical protein
MDREPVTTIEPHVYQSFWDLGILTGQLYGLIPERYKRELIHRHAELSLIMGYDFAAENCIDYAFFIFEFVERIEHARETIA